MLFLVAESRCGLGVLPHLYRIIQLENGLHTPAEQVDSIPAGMKHFGTSASSDSSMSAALYVTGRRDAVINWQWGKWSQPVLGTILVVDDKASVRRVLSMELADAGFDVLEAADGIEGFKKLRQHEPDLIITDLIMPNCDGQSFLQRVKAVSDVPVLMFSSQGTIENAVSAVKTGAEDFLSWQDDRLDDIVRRARSLVAQRQPSGAQATIEQLLPGDSDWAVQLRDRIIALSGLHVPVLVTGEEGTGKSTTIEALHSVGPFSENRLQVIECTDTPDSVPNRFEGPVCLRKIDRLSRKAQNSFTQILARQASTLSTQFRLFATASPGVESSLLPGLRAQLAPYMVRLLPLRKRPDDMEAIAALLVSRLATIAGREIVLSQDAHRTLMAHDWPYNIAQLRDVLSRSVISSKGREIQATTIRGLLQEYQQGIWAERERAERNEILAALRDARGVRSRAADILGMSRTTFWRRLKVHKIDI